MVKRSDSDLIVVGACGAGLSATQMASEARACVEILGASEQLGGLTALTGGVALASATSVQHAKGILHNTPFSL